MIPMIPSSELQSIDIQVSPELLKKHMDILTTAALYENVIYSNMVYFFYNQWQRLQNQIDEVSTPIKLEYCESLKLIEACLMDVTRSIIQDRQWQQLQIIKLCAYEVERTFGPIYIHDVEYISPIKKQYASFSLFVDLIFKSIQTNYLSREQDQPQMDA